MSVSKPVFSTPPTSKFSLEDSNESNDGYSSSSSPTVAHDSGVSVPNDSSSTSVSDSFSTTSLMSISAKSKSTSAVTIGFFSFLKILNKPFFLPFLALFFVARLPVGSSTLSSTALILVESTISFKSSSCEKLSTTKPYFFFKTSGLNSTKSFTKFVLNLVFRMVVYKGEINTFEATLAYSTLLNNIINLIAG